MGRSIKSALVQQIGTEGSSCPYRTPVASAVALLTSGLLVGVIANRVGARGSGRSFRCRRQAAAPLQFQRDFPLVR